MTDLTAFTVYRCGCTHREPYPDLCPGHHSHQIGGFRVPTDQIGIGDQHLCDDHQPCPPEGATL